MKLIFSFKKIRLKASSPKGWPFRVGLIALTENNRRISAKCQLFETDDCKSIYIWPFFMIWKIVNIYPTRHSLIHADRLLIKWNIMTTCKSAPLFSFKVLNAAWATSNHARVLHTSCKHAMNNKSKQSQRGDKWRILCSHGDTPQ